MKLTLAKREREARRHFAAAVPPRRIAILRPEPPRITGKRTSLGDLINAALDRMEAAE